MYTPSHFHGIVSRSFVVNQLCTCYLGSADLSPETNTIASFVHKVVNKWFQDRTILIGDAAHVFPPFGAQGISNGVRDAIGLSWRLSFLLAPTRVPQLKSEELLHGWSQERRWGVDEGSILTMRNGDLMNNKSWLKSYGIWTAWRVLDFVPGLKSWIIYQLYSDLNGFRGVKNGFFLPESGGGGRIAQIWVEEQDESPNLSDRVLWQSNSVLTLLCLSDDVPATETNEVNRLLDMKNLGSKILSPQVEQIVASTRTQPSVKRPKSSRMKRYQPCNVQMLNAAEIYLPQGYSETAFARRFQRGTRYALMSPDMIVFSQASTLSQASAQLDKAVAMLGI